MIDAASVAATVATVVGWLPSVVSLLTGIWIFIRIIESNTVQRLIAKMRGKPG